MDGMFIRRVIKRILPFLAFFMLVIPLFVTADFGDVYLDSSFEDTIGAQSGTLDHMTYDDDTGCSSDCWGIDNAWSHTGTRSFQVYTRTTGAPTYEPSGWWNLTSSYDYIGQIEFWMEYTSGYGDADGHDCYVDLQFFDDDDVQQLRLRMNANGELRYFEDGVGYNTLYDFDNLDNDVGRVVITHYDTNTFWYSVYNETGNLNASELGSGAINTDWNTFSYVQIFTADGNNDYVSIYFDDFKINTQPSYEVVNRVTSITCDNLCNDVIIGSTHQYEIDVDGIGDIFAYLRITNESGHSVVFKGLERGLNTVNVYYPYEFGAGSWLIEAFDSQYLFDENDTYYYENCSFNVVENEILTNYTSYYGDFFVEWLTDGSNCYYAVDDNPSVVYYVNDSFLTDTTLGYIVDIKDVIGKETVYTFFIMNLSFDMPIIKRLGGYAFEKEGFYYLTVSNTTENAFGTNDLIRDTIIYISQPMEVCTYHEYDDYDGVTHEGDEDDTFLGYPVGLWYIIFGVGMCLFFFMLPSLVSHNWKHPMPKTVNLFSGVIGVIGCTLFGLFPLWLLFVFCLVLAVVIVAKAKEMI